MTEPRSGITPVEALRNTERIFMGESRCEVPEGSKDIATAFGKAEPGKTFDPLKSLVITDIPIGIDGNPIRTEQQIKDLSSKVQKLVEEGKISGLYLNCLSKSGQEGIAAKMSIIFLEIFVNKLEDGKSVTEAIADLIELGKNDTQSEEIDGFSAVVVKDGKAHVVGLEDKVAVKIIKADGSVDIQKSGDEIGLEKDSKIVLCSKDDARLDSVKGLSVEQIVEELNKPPVSEKEKKQVTVEKKYNAPNGIGAYDDRFFICESTGFVGVIDGASGIGGGGKNAADTAWIVLATETGGDTLQFDGKKREEVEESLRKIAERANREIRIHTRTSGKAVCLSTGEIYQDADGKLSFSYINHGDTEIAIVKKDGSVQLVPNHSIRHLSETDPRGINLYLSEREASFKLMEGQNTRELDQKIIVGSIDIDEGDKVIFLTDGVAEDLHNIRGSVSSDGTISPQKGSDGKQIGLDILSQVKDLDAKSASSKIMDLLAEVRAIPEDKGVIVTRHSNINNSEVRRKIVQKDGLNIVVGGKGPKTDKGYDDGETVVVMEAKMTKEKVLGQAHGVAVGEVKSETVQQAAQQIEPTPQPASDLAGWEQANQIRAALEASGEKEAKKVEEQFIKAKAVAILAEPHNDQTRGEEALKKVLQRITDTGKSPDFYNLPGVGEFLRSSLEKDALTKNDSDIFDRTRNKIAYNLDSPQGVQGALDYLKAICVDPSDGRDIASKEQLIDFYTDRVIEKIEHRIKFNKDRTSIATDQDQPLHRLAQLAGVQRLVDEGKLDDAFFADVKKMRVEKQQKAAVHAEVKPPGPVPAPERAKKEGVFEAVDDGSETVSLTKITDPKHEATYQFDRINKSVLDAKFFSDTAQSNLPPELKRDPNETPTAYKKRILTAIQSRLAQAPADPSKDSLYTMLITGTKPDPRLLAQVVEADLLLIQQQERKEQIKVLKASFPENPHLMGREVHQRGLRDAVEDVSLDYFAHKGEVDAQGRELFVAPEAKLDILAFRLVSNSMLDVVDHGIASVFSHPDQAPVKAVVDGIITDYAKAHNNKYPSYRELLNALRSRIDAQSKGESKDDQGRFISRVAEARIRGIFYDNVYTMLENSRNYDATSQTVLNRTDLPQPVMDMLKQLNIEICDNGWVDSHKIPQLIQKYTQLRAGEQSGKGDDFLRQQMLEPDKMAHLQANLLLLALKGTERMKQTAKTPIVLPKPSDEVVHIKKFREGGDKKTPQTPVEKLIRRVNPEPSSTPDQTGDQLPPAPTGGTETGDPNPNPPPGPTQGPSATPVRNTPQPSPNGEAPSGIRPPEADNRPVPVNRTVTPGPENNNPAPVPEKGRRPGTLEPAPTNPPGGKKEDLPTKMTLGIAGSNIHAEQNLASGAAHYMARDAAKPHHTKRDFFAKPFLWLKNKTQKVPVVNILTSVSYGVINSVLHPVQTWKNSFARNASQVRSLRFASDLTHIVRQESGYTDGVPLEVSNDIMDKALEGGKQYRSKNIFKRIGIWATDILSDATGIGQHSEQRYAKTWLRETNEGKALIKDRTAQVLAEQDALGQKYALVQEGLSLEESNRRVISTHAGETRIALAQHNPELQKAATHEIKIRIAEYMKTGKTEEDKKNLIKGLNNYLLGRFKSRLRQEDQAQLNASEVASNILSVVDKIAQNWDAYQQKGSGGKSKWDEFEFDIYLGKTRGEAKRGNIEMDLLTERLARRLANREVMGGSKAIAEAVGIVELIKDNLTTFGLYFAGAWITGAARSPGMLLSKFFPVGGGAMVGMAVLKETGLSIPGLKHIHKVIAGHDFSPFRWHGRFQQEVSQVSRESAIGREATADSPNRREIVDKLLVARKDAETDFIVPLTADLKAMTEGNITPEKAKETLARLAELDARIRMSDKSGTRDMNYHTQNYIQYKEGLENQQDLQLRSLLMNGISALTAYAEEHPGFIKDFNKGDSLVKASGVMYRQNGAGTAMGALDKLSTLVEAQLRYGSENTKAMKQWLKSEMKFTDMEIQDVLDSLPGVKIGVDHNSALRTKENALFRAAMQHGTKVALMSALAMPVAGTVYRELGVGAQALRHEGMDIASHISTAGGVQFNLHSLSDFGRSIQESVSHVGAGMSEYGQEWGKVLSGQPVLEFDAAGNLVSGLTDFQRGALTLQGVVNGVVTPPFWPLQHLILARQPIDGIPVDLPPEFHHSVVSVPLPGGGSEQHEIIFNSATGDVFDMNNFELDIETDALGVNHLVVVDSGGGHAVINADAFFGTAHGTVKIVEGAPVTAVNDVWKPDATTKVVSPDGIHNVEVPTNTTFSLDPTTNKWDLVAVDAAGKQVGPPIINDAEFDASDKMTYDSGSTGIITQNQHVVHGVAAVPAVVAPAHIIAPGGKIDPNGAWGQHDTPVIRDGWDPTDRLKFFNHKDGDAVVFDISKVASIHGKGGETGVYITLPGHPNEGIFLGGDVHMIEPNSNIQIPGANGMTYGELYDMIINEEKLGGFVNASELGHRDIFKFDNAEAAVKTIDANGHEHILVGATIKGSGAIPEVPVTVGTPEITETTTYQITVEASPITQEVETPTFIVSTQMPQLNVFYAPWIVRTPVERSVAAGQGEKIEDRKQKVDGGKKKAERDKKIEEADKILEERGRKKDGESDVKIEWTEEDKEFLQEPLATPEELLRKMGISIAENEKFKDKDKKVKTQKFKEYEIAVEIMKQYEAAYRAGDTGAMQLQRKALAALLSKWEFTPENDDEKKGLFKRPDREQIFDRVFTEVEGKLAAQIALLKEQKEMAEAQEKAEKESAKQKVEQQQQEQIRRQEEVDRAYTQQYLEYVEKMAKADAVETDAKELLQDLKDKQIEGMKKKVMIRILLEKGVSKADLQEYMSDLEKHNDKVEDYSEIGKRIYAQDQELQKSTEFKERLEVNIQHYTNIMAEAEQEALKRIEAVRNPAASSAVAANVS